MCKFVSIFKLIVVVAVCSFWKVNVASSSRILFYLGFGSKSHKIEIWPLAEALAERGHHVTFISPYPESVSNPKIRELTGDGSIKKFVDAGASGTLDTRLDGSYQSGWERYLDGGYEVCKLTLADKEIRKLLIKDKFDLVLIDSFCSECGLGLAYAFKSKFIIYGTTSLMMWQPDMVGLVPETSWIPDMQYHFRTPMNFFQRVWSTLSPIYWHFWKRRWSYFPKMDELLKKELEIPNMPKLEEIERNVSLMFFNTHFSFEYGRSLPPSVIPVGGLHIKPSVKNLLPKGIGEFIDGSGDDGVIYISFGTFAKASKLPEEIRQVFYRTLSYFEKTRFIWVWDVERPKEMPNNVLTVKWAPQQDILVHKKTKAFITHCGALSLLESTHIGVPLVMFPLAGDQDYNAHFIEENGYGIKLEIANLSVDTFQDAIRRILADEKYKLRALEVSRLFKDRPQTPLETAVWWSEYVLRQNNTNAMKPLSMNQTWYERRLLDVWAFLLSILVLTLFILSSLIYFLIVRICSSSKSQVVLNVKNKKKKH